MGPPAEQDQEHLTWHDLMHAVAALARASRRETPALHGACVHEPNGGQPGTGTNSTRMHQIVPCQVFLILFGGGSYAKRNITCVCVWRANLACVGSSFRCAASGVRRATHNQ